MGTHSSVLAWRIPGTGEPGGLLSLGESLCSATGEAPQGEAQVPQLESRPRSPQLERAHAATQPQHSQK